MPLGGSSTREGIDPQWLARAVADDPVVHAYALWDLERAPESTRFVTYGHGPKRSYLLIWSGDPGAPVVHWVGDDPSDLPLGEAIPRHAAVVVVPERGIPVIQDRFRGATFEPLLVMHRPLNSPPLPPIEPPAARLSPAYAEELGRFADHYRDRLSGPYRTIDLAAERVWGRFEAGELVGVARTTVTLPPVWIVSGVYVAPPSRGRGHGRALTCAATAAALHAGATAGLFVRERNPAAVHVYESLGYRPVARRFWFDLAHSPGAAPSAR